MTDLSAAPPLAPDKSEPPQADLQKVAAAMRSAQAYLLSQQAPEGYWAGELGADASVTAGYIPLMYFFFGWVDPTRQRKVIEFMRRSQKPDGSWPTHYGGPGDLDVTIQCYFSLKLGGIPADEPILLKAKEFIRTQGGLTRAKVFTKIWLAVFGQYDYSGIPNAPPEVIFLPDRFIFNIYDFASWSRETLMAITILLTQKPVHPVPEHARLDELYLEPPGESRSPLGKIGSPFTWRGFFQLADRLFKLWERLPVKPGRKRALRKVEAWIVKHQEADGSWGGILLPWIYSLFALRSLDYPLEHPVIALGIQGFEDFILEDGETLHFQAATSPVWDTAWSVLALRESGLKHDDRALIKAANWLLGKEIRSAGDWRVKNPHLEPGGWSFEFKNDWYPDLDDSSLVPRALLRVGLAGEAVVQRSQAVKRSVNWVLGMQSKDGGWGAFDRDNNLQALNHVPFADFLTPLDPTCADVTAHAIEFLAEVNQGEAARKKAISFLRRIQEPDGSWYGRWGVNYLYGTGLALTGLRSAGEEMSQPYIRKAVEWLLVCQNVDGGWGETCLTYSDPGLRGQGESTASQTAWALMGLFSAGELDREEVGRAFDFLLAAQQEDGSWSEPQFTGTGFPGVFYLRYDLYRIYFPLLALASYARLTRGSDVSS